jgi:hypothetical protein
VVTVSNFFYTNTPTNSYNPVQEVRFEDGTVWDLAEIQNQLATQTPKLQALEGTPSSGTNNHARSTLPDSVQQPDLTANDPLSAPHKPYALDGWIAPLKPYPFAAAGMEFGPPAFYPDLPAGFPDASLDSQMHQLLSAMAGFAPAPAGQTSVTDGAYDRHMLAPVVASSLA